MAASNETVYIDASALLKRWLEGVEEVSAVAHILEDPHRRFTTNHLTTVEITSAISRRVRMGELPREAGESLLSHLLRKLERFIEIGKLRLYPMSEEVVAESIRCLRRCAVLGLALRSLDALHIATALSAESPEPPLFITADKQQSRAARALGLETHLL